MKGCKLLLDCLFSWKKLQVISFFILGKGGEKKTDLHWMFNVWMFNVHTVDPFSFLQGWASVLFKRTFRSRIHFRSVQRNILFSTYISDLFVLYVHFGSVQKNVLFSTFISVQWKWMFCSLRSFLLCKKNVCSFWLGPKSPQKWPKKGATTPERTTGWP